MKKTIRLCSESGNVESVVKQFKQLLHTFPNIEFRSATINQQLSKIPNDKTKPEFYPLILTSEHFEIKVSEVRCGYRGCSCDAMIEILKLAGFNPTRKTIETIYNSPNINITIWKENQMQQV